MPLDIQLLAWNTHTNVARLNRLMGSQSIPHKMYVVVRFVTIGGIVDLHSLNVLFINLTYMHLFGMFFSCSAMLITLYVL
jgi:hypothetical protein